jgi:hypothetical protein
MPFIVHPDHRFPRTAPHGTRITSGLTAGGRSTTRQIVTGLGVLCRSAYSIFGVYQSGNHVMKKFTATLADALFIIRLASIEGLRSATSTLLRLAQLSLSYSGRNIYHRRYP